MANVKSAFSRYEARLIAKGFGLTDEQIDDAVDLIFKNKTTINGSGSSRYSDVSFRFKRIIGLQEKHNFISICKSIQKENAEEIQRLINLTRPAVGWLDVSGEIWKRNQLQQHQDRLVA